MDDNQIVKLLFDRDESALDEVKTKYGRLITRIAENITGSREDGEECASDALLALWQNVPPESPDPLVAYILRIVRNLAIKRKRTDSSQKRSPDAIVCLDELAETLCTADTEVDESALGGALDSFLLSLGEVERRLFVRRYWYCEDIASLADEFSLGVSAVKVRLHRTRNKLKNYLHKEGLL